MMFCCGKTGFMRACGRGNRADLLTAKPGLSLQKVKSNAKMQNVSLILILRYLNVSTYFTVYRIRHIITYPTIIFCEHI